MKSTLKPLALALSGAALLTLYGCGGNDSNDSTPAAVQPAETTISGVVFDGLLANATVCLDLDDNRDCGANEPTATTAADGTFTLTASEADAAAHPLLAKAIAGKTTNAGVPVTAGFMFAAPAGQAAVISPYTTLVQSEIDGGRAPNRGQAETNILNFMVGVAGDVGGLDLYSNYIDENSTLGTAAKRGKMTGLGQLLTAGFEKTAATSGLTGKAALGALGQAATGSLQQVLSQVAGPLTPEDRTTLFNALQDSLVPTAEHLKDVATAQARTAAAPIEGAWVRSVDKGAVVSQELYLFAGDGTFVHQTIDPGVAPLSSNSATTAFDNGFGYRYGRYTLSAGALTTRLIETSEAAGPPEGTLNNVTVSGNTLTMEGGATFTRVTGSDPLVGGWIRPNGSNTPEFLVMFDDGSYVHSTFYYQNDPQTGSATFFETAKSAGLRKGAYAVDKTVNASVVNFGATTVLFNGNLAIPSNPGVAHIQTDGSLSMTGLRLVKLGSVDGAKAVTGFSEATRSRLWSGRYFSRSVSVGGANRLQYVYVRGPNDVLTFLQPTSATTQACADNPGGTPLPDFTSVAPDDGKLKQFVVGTSTGATVLYAQRRLNVGVPGSVVTYTPIAKPTNTTARCIWPL